MTRMKGKPPSRLLRKALGTPLVVAGSLPADHTDERVLGLDDGTEGVLHRRVQPVHDDLTFSTVSSLSKTWMASLGEPDVEVSHLELQVGSRAR